ncbi:hypothetical protein EVAR_49354_1 [Eumeta japonica]|uniref:Uncharacterized protein n=1 Tax=Eumeta variegata TaxID=151549 RepID=A0A4C1XWC9_EUMVA|nr:hypothetical protein EVAR_49354_1 [Eumeta japonica]
MRQARTTPVHYLELLEHRIEVSTRIKSRQRAGPAAGRRLHKPRESPPSGVGDPDGRIFVHRASPLAARPAALRRARSHVIAERPDTRSRPSSRTNGHIRAPPTTRAERFRATVRLPEKAFKSVEQYQYIPPQSIHLRPKCVCAPLTAVSVATTMTAGPTA